jgi:hypothetical protein
MRIGRIIEACGGCQSSGKTDQNECLRDQRCSKREPQRHRLINIDIKSAMHLDCTLTPNFLRLYWRLRFLKGLLCRG